jgi:hypothetical protein
MQSDESLLQLVKSAVRRTVVAVREQHPQASLAGYALLTNDTLATLTYMAITKEALAASGNDDLLFCPTDWPYEYESALFVPAGKQLSAMESVASDLEEHVERAFDMLVQALATSRAEGLFSEEVFLSVLSPEPSPKLEELEKISVEGLNRNDIIEGRERFLRRWNC